MSEPWVRFEDEHLLAVEKPAGVNTHRADVHAQEGMYEWVQRQRPADALSILHRLDKGTSGLLVFGKSTAANRSVGAQFAERSIAKHYELLTARDDSRASSLRSDLAISKGAGADPSGLPASTDFAREATGPHVERFSARPRSGRTHQVRVHAAALNMPIIGDAEHGGAEGVRLFLHAAGLRLDHPLLWPIELTSPRPASFDALLRREHDDEPSNARLAAMAAHEARALLFDPSETNAYLWIDRHHDGFAGLRVERLGDVGLVLNYDDTGASLPGSWLDAWNDTLTLRAVYEQPRPRGGGRAARLVSGMAGAQFEVLELGIRYLIDLTASATSCGLFLDQRETRRELRTADLSGRTVLNAFAHTGSLSVAAAMGGAETLSLDLSKRYLDWAAENLRVNGLDPADHDFVYGDAIEWMDRLAKKGRRFDLVLIDPPSASTSRHRRAKRWSVERDLDRLVERASRLCAPGGSIYASTNLRRMQWPQFLGHVERGLAAAGRVGTIVTRTVPLDHRSGPGDPPHLKAAWIKLDGDSGAAPQGDQ